MIIMRKLATDPMLKPPSLTPPLPAFGEVRRGEGRGRRRQMKVDNLTFYIFNKLILIIVVILIVEQLYVV